MSVSRRLPYYLLIREIKGGKKRSANAFGETVNGLKQFTIFRLKDWCVYICVCARVCACARVPVCSRTQKAAF